SARPLMPPPTMTITRPSRPSALDPLAVDARYGPLHPRLDLLRRLHAAQVELEVRTRSRLQLVDEFADLAGRQAVAGETGRVHGTRIGPASHTVPVGLQQFAQGLHLTPTEMPAGDVVVDPCLVG